MADINKSITATIKSISDKKNLIFFFKKNFIKIEGNKVYLPDINSIKNKIDLQNFRGIADFLALKLKFHNSYIYNDYKPKKTNSIELFEALEEARIISLGSFYMKGIASNLKLRLDLYCKKNQFNKIKKTNNSQITQVIKLFATQQMRDSAWQFCHVTRLPVIS